ncbi:MAG: hypothetical protein ABS52_01630 [Gemmatimonadetes bacterium SCN 70-22]|nr:MAG: hypothetical protein ABS52_01630 [Gemmatimonadetes bacterium SCN 70-22]
MQMPDMCPIDSIPPKLTINAMAPHVGHDERASSHQFQTSSSAPSRVGAGLAGTRMLEKCSASGPR